jgi:hypothetical protein
VVARVPGVSVVEIVVYRTKSVLDQYRLQLRTVIVVDVCPLDWAYALDMFNPDWTVLLVIVEDR